MKVTLFLGFLFDSCIGLTLTMTFNRTWCSTEMGDEAMTVYCTIVENIGAEVDDLFKVS